MLSVAVALLLLLTGSAFAAPAWTLTTADFKATPVDPKQITADTLVPAGDAAPVPLERVVGLARAGTPKPAAGLVLCTADGQRLAGTPKRIDGNALVWFASGVGDVPVPLDRVLGVLRDRTTLPGLSDARTEDAVRLTTGDTVRGALSDVSAEGFTIVPTGGGGPVKLAPASVTHLLLATPPGGRQAVAAPAWFVRVAGSRVAADAVGLAGDRLTLKLPAAGEAVVPLAQVEAIDHPGGPVAWLADREPVESVHTPYLDGSYPARPDASVTGSPLRFGGVTYAHGIGVHSRSRLVYAVGQEDKTFRTRYAIDGNLPLADVDVTVLLDGKPVHTRMGLRAGELSPVVEVPLAGAKTLTLLVDYGRNYDVQDRLDWIEPAIVRR